MWTSDVPRSFSSLSRWLAPVQSSRRAWRLAPSVALAGFVACGGNNAAPPEMPPAAVEVRTVQPSDVPNATEYVATIKSFSSATIRPQVEGQVTRILVKSGDRVRQGQPLLQIDPARQRAAVSSQASARTAQEANVAFAKQQLARSKELLAVGAISQQEYEQAETTYNTATAELGSLSAQVREGNVLLQYYQVLAPSTGIIGDVPVRVGDRVTPDTLLTTIDQNSALELYVQVPVEQSNQLRAGLPIEILSNTGEKLGETTVSFISPRVDDQTQAILVKGNVKNEGVFRSLQFVRARIVWSTEPGLVVPVVAAVRINGQHFVYVVEQKDGKAVARQRPIKVGAIVKDDYVVLGGLKPNEQIVVSGVQKLGDGAPVQVKAA